MRHSAHDLTEMPLFAGNAGAHAPDHGHRFDGARRWDASLDLAFERRLEGQREVTRLSRLRSDGPLRVQRPFYPEGPEGSCHVYLLHPPGGLVSGDRLAIRADVGQGARALLTTPAAAKVYGADRHGVTSAQQVMVTVRDGGLLEYLPQQTIVFDGARAVQETRLDLEAGGRSIGWEVLSLGRPASQLPFVSGRVSQRFWLQVGGRPAWHERQILDPKSPGFQGAWGQGGCGVQATLWAHGLCEPDQAVDEIRRALAPAQSWGVTCRAGVLLFRYLGDSAAEAWDLCAQTWSLLRPRLLGEPACPPRIWFT